MINKNNQELLFDDWKNIDIVDRVVHIHIPKTGGTWLNTQLTNLGVTAYDHSTISVCLSNLNQRFPVWSCDSQPSLGLSMKSEPEYDKFKKACKIGIVRNPFDWLVSYYLHTGSGKWSHHRGWDDIVNTHNIESFEHFVRTLCNPQKRWWHVWLKRCIFYQVFNEKGNIGVDIILKKENLTNGTVQLFLDLGLVRDEIEINQTFINKNPINFDYRSYYTSELIDITSKFFEQELAIFDYKFESTGVNKPYYLSEEFTNLDWKKCMEKTKF
jgi:hypothetical protein